MIIIGDIHGKIKPYKELLDKFKIRYPAHSTVQLGDFGAGFVQIPELPDNSYFIRGNHDDPAKCRESKHYLGDYGYTEIDGWKVFYLSGAWSIDRIYRTENISWWADEELSIPELNKAVELYMKVKPDLVISHDGPKIATRELAGRYWLNINPDGTREDPVRPTRTGQALSAMWESHEPKQWFFGHWHDDYKVRIGRTTFQCLDELSWVVI